MISVKFANIASSTISVTSTATSLTSLIDTAGSTTNGFSPDVNGVDLVPEDGSVRLAYQVSPTSTQGFLITQGNTLSLRGIDLSQLFLIRTGAANVAVSLMVGQTEPGENSSMPSSGSVGSSITIGLNDDIPLTFGTSSDARIVWDTADANSHHLALGLNSGGNNSSTFLITDDSLVGVDKGFWDGETEPGWAVTDSTGVSYIELRYNGTQFAFGTNAVGTEVLFNSILNITPPTLTNGQPGDSAFDVSSTLNDPGPAGGTDTFANIKTDITPTNVLGWNRINLVDHKYNNVTQFRVDKASGIYAKVATYSPAYYFVEGSQAAGGIGKTPASGFDTAVSIFGNATDELVNIVSANNRSSGTGQTGGSNPLFSVFSGTLFSSATDEWVSLQHNRTDGIVNVGSGDLSLQSVAGNVKTSNNFQVGGTTDITWQVNIAGTALASASESISRYSAGIFGPYLALRHSRGITVDAHTVMDDNDEIGAIRFYGSDGTDWELGADIFARIDGTPGNNDIPGEIVIRTYDNSSGTERARFRPGGQIEFDGGVQFNEGSNVASANDIILPSIANFYTITGTSDINTISGAGWRSGSVVFVKFAGTAATNGLRHNQTGTGSKILFNSASDFAYAPNNTLTLVYDGSNWLCDQ